jgi:pimeloyl-ACP methyl ester carboxylesterase
MASLHTLDPNPAGHPAVLLLHGLGADGASWVLQIPALSQAGFRPIAPDMPGFGRSIYDGAGWNFRRVAAQMAGLLTDLGASPAHVVGLSMGGVIAQQLALDFPQMVRKLVLTSTFAYLQPDTVSGWIYFMRRAILVSTMGLPAQARLVARRVFPAETHAPLREMLVQTISQANPRAYRRAMFSLGRFDSRRRLKEIAAPTLVITGADDSTVTPRRQAHLAVAIPGAIHKIVQKAGHAVPVDQPDEYNRLLLEFLGD